MAFDESEYNEAPYARAVADAVGAEHYERIITAADVSAELEEIFTAMDQPSIDGINSYFVSKTAREAGLTVALSGLGGDELFGGYGNTFRGVPRVLQAVQWAQRARGGTALARAGIQTFTAQARWRKIADALDRPASRASAYLACRGLFSSSELHVGGALPVEVRLGRSPRQQREHHLDEQHGLQARLGRLGFEVSRAELGTYTRDQLLRDIDVMSMAHSLEVRVPLLDDRLVETALRLPDAAKRNGGRPKSLLVDAVGDLLPQEIRSRRAKQGFVFPFGAWLRGPLRHHCDGWSEGLGGLLRVSGLESARQQWQAGHLHWSRAWALAALQGWRATTQNIAVAASR